MSIQDQLQIVEDNLNEYGQCNITLEEFNFLKEQIRADAIEEYKIALHTKYKENKAFAYSVWGGNIYKYDAMANLDLEEIDEIAEQLKEQKNDN